MKSILLSLLAVATVTNCPAAIFSWSPSLAIPDNSPVGVADTRTVSAPFSSITSVKVHLEITSTWNGDLYAYLSHDSGFTTLLNRVGRTSVNLAGSSSQSMILDLSDAALADVHVSAPLTNTLFTGTFQPDGRGDNPGTGLDTDTRTDDLSSFDGLDPNGDWTLFIADLGAGETSILDNWAIEIEGVPEPSVPLLAAIGGVLCVVRRKR